MASYCRLTHHHSSTATYDYNGFNDYRDLLDTSLDQFDQNLAVAGMAGDPFHFCVLTCSQAERVKAQQVDLNLQTAYGITGAQPKNLYEAACQYYQVDWVCDCFPCKLSGPLMLNWSGMQVSFLCCRTPLIIVTYNY